MQVQELALSGLKLVKPKAFDDDRGFFLETFSQDRYREAGIDSTFVQANHSRSTRGTLRGLHFQTDPGQAKLLYCVRGEILDVAVDVRLGSPTFGQYVAVLLNDSSHHQLFVPVGFAHGFCTLSDYADVTYQVSSPYNAESERGIAYNDPDINVRWPSDIKLILSDRDKSAPLLRDFDWSDTPWQKS